MKKQYREDSDLPEAGEFRDYREKVPPFLPFLPVISWSLILCDIDRITH